MFTLLPELLSASVLPSEFSIAYINGNPDCIVGAAAYIPQLTGGRHSGYTYYCHILPTFTDTDIQRQLTRHVAERAAQWGVRYLHFGKLLTEAEQYVAVLREVGFTPRAELYQFTGAIHDVLRPLSRLMNSLTRRRRITAPVAIQPIAQTDTRQLLPLFTSQFGITSNAARHEIQQAIKHPLTNALSMALTNQGEVIAFLLAKVVNNEPEVAFWTSAGTYRFGWPAALLLDACCRKALLMGFERSRFACDSQTLATTNIAKRSGARLEAVKSSYVLELTPQ